VPTPSLSPWLDRELLIVTGKGGVGKTTIAAAIAWQAARSGLRVLACELDAVGNLDACIVGPTGSGSAGGQSGYKPKERRPGLWTMSMDPEESLKEYLGLNLKIPFIAKIGVLSGVFDFLANAAPGVREVVTIGKVAFDVRQRAYDLVVVDAPASGHVIGLLRAPDAISELVGIGQIRNQTRWMLDVLNDPKRTGVVAVTTPEEMPVTETLELIDRLRDEAHVDLAGVVLNRVLPEPFSLADERVLTALRADVRATEAALGRGGVNLLESAAVAIALRRRREPHLQRLLAGLPAGTATALVPLFEGAQPGPSTTESIADALADELGW
jgi:anion-transporting  ArsA/GET3 family ATPase